MKTLLVIFITFAAAIIALAGDFVGTVGTQFRKPGKATEPYYFIGTNIWYTPILASKGEGGDRERLKAELDHLQDLGIDNLRILVGADAGSRNANTVQPCLQYEDGTLNDTLLDGLDYLLRELERRDMYAVLYLNNAWDWSGGYGHYLKRTGHADSPNAADEGYNDYVKYAAGFSTDTLAQQLYLDFVSQIVSRKNRYTRKPYAESPAIMSWQICNEPRPFAKESKKGFARWILSTARLIKRIDPNHLVSIGSEGYYGCEKDISLYEHLHAADCIDYFTIHIWPVNWGWSPRGALFTSLPNAYLRSREYIDMHERIAIRYNKPLVIEEFGYPRDRNFREPGSKTQSRDAYYNFVFEELLRSKAENGAIAGVNFWGWGGKGRANSHTWKPGNGYLCDPPHEPQGWYSVFDTDASTLELITKSIRRLTE